MSKYGNIKVKTKKPWEVSRGHNIHRSGSGNHDNRPRRVRTRMDIRRRAIDEYQ
jgi:hypothetical protein